MQHLKNYLNQMSTMFLHNKWITFSIIKYLSDINFLMMYNIKVVCGFFMLPSII